VPASDLPFLRNGTFAKSVEREGRREGGREGGRKGEREGKTRTNQGGLDLPLICHEGEMGDAIDSKPFY